MMTVGYGEIRGFTDIERLFLIFVAFASLFVVSLIRSSVLNLLSIHKLRELIKDVRFDVEFYMHKVDKTIPNRHIAADYYDTIA